MTPAAKLVGFLVLLALIFAGAHMAGARRRPVTDELDRGHPEEAVTTFLVPNHLAPGGLPVLGGGGGGPGGGGGNPRLVPETTTVAICVIVAWLVGWSILGAWRMMTRDA